MSKKNADNQNFPTRTGASGGTSERGASGFDNPAETPAEDVLNATLEVTVNAPLLVPVAETSGEATKVKTKIESLVEEMEVTEKRATADLDSTDPRTRPGREWAKREAQEHLVKLKVKYWAHISKGLCAIFVHADRIRSDEFVAVSTKAAPVEALYVAADKLYRQLAQEVESRMRTDRMFEPSQFALLMQATMILCADLGLADAPALKFRDGALLKTHEDVVDHVRKLIREACGDQLNAHFMRELVEKAAWQIRYSDDVVPVIVTGSSDHESEDLGRLLFNNRTVVANLGDEAVTGAKILSAFKALKNKVRFG